MYKIGASINSTIINEDLFREVKSSGLSAIEISHSSLDGYENFDFNNVRKLSNVFGVELWSLHLPFLPFGELDTSSLDHNIQKYTFDNFLELIKKGSDIGIEKFIVHSSGEPIEDSKRKDRLDSATDFLSRLADEADKSGAIIAVEDLPRSCIGRNSEEINYILSANDKLRVCFDTNHLLGEKITDFIKKLGNKIISTHISDYDFVNERHWMPGEGDINWFEVYNALKEVDYKGIWLYELDLKPPKSIIRRDMTYSDLYNNAIEIFNNKKPTSIGNRIENLGFWG